MSELPPPPPESEDAPRAEGEESSGTGPALKATEPARPDVRTPRRLVWHDRPLLPHPPKTPRWPFVLGAVALVALLVLLATNPDTFMTASNTASPASSATSPAAPSSPAYVIFDDGSFGFIINAFKCADISPTNSCTADLHVFNSSSQAQTYFAANQYLFDKAGNRYDSSQDLTEVSNDIADVNPGLSVDVSVRFMLPAGAVPDHLQLHDSAFSDGVDAPLCPTSNGPSGQSYAACG